MKSQMMHVKNKTQQPAGLFNINVNHTDENLTRNQLANDNNNIVRKSES